ncbi:hypothetical protein CRM22_007793 [Opisthorchis felineus]|uniref:Acyl-CoA-binding domain-containing protein 6 n=1 Tax=Opisthorchis felineus TaxID=147828 RepID=A0A4S2LMK4_OPIFE|nr:hypothetical protein CRM22_007793 [Opisthorchis felineus]
MASNPLPFEDMFDQAVKHVPQLANGLDTETLLYFYARYKQATVGPCNTPKPGFFDFNGRKKWQAWSDLADMSEDQARREYVSKLFEVDPSWDPKDQSNKCAIYVSRMVCLDPEKVDGDCPDERDKPVFQAVKEDRLDLLQTILRDSPNVVNVTDSAMMTPLHWASDRGYTEIISTLLAHSADVNARDKDNQTPLHYACACGHLSGAKQLLQAGADLNAKDADGMSPLELAEDQFRSELMST